MRDWKVGDYEYKRRGIYFSAVHYFCTEVNRDEEILHCICMQTHLFTQHIHAHTCTHKLTKALLQRQNRQMNESCAFGFGS